jgi:hypothetical protein
MSPGCYERFHIIERETIRVLPVFRNDKSLKHFEAGQLAIDVQHFGLEKESAEASDQGFRR